MELRRKITSLTSDNTVAELSEVLDHAHRVTISWWGQRLVSVEGYQGSVTIDELASKYLHSAPFDTNAASTLQDRLTCEGLWDRVQELYADSEAPLANTYVYKFLVPMIESIWRCLTCGGDPMSIILELDGPPGRKRDTVFLFTPTEFRQLWPDAERAAHGLSWTIGGGEDSVRWYASKEMVESALRA